MPAPAAEAPAQRSGARGPGERRSGGAGSGQLGSHQEALWEAACSLLLRGEAGTARQQPGPHSPARSGHSSGCRPSTHITLRPRLPGADGGKAGTGATLASAPPALPQILQTPELGIEVAIPLLCSRLSLGFVWPGNTMSSSTGAVSSSWQPSGFVFALAACISHLERLGLAQTPRPGQERAALPEELKISSLWSCLSKFTLLGQGAVL